MPLALAASMVPPPAAIAAPPMARPVPTAALAPSCGPPETSPVAMLGPKMPRPSGDSSLGP